MRSDKYVVTVAGKQIGVDATFSDEPAIWRVDADGIHVTHINGNNGREHFLKPLVEALKPGDVIMIGHYVEVPAAERCKTSGCEARRQPGDDFCKPCRDDVEDFKRTGDVNYTGTKRAPGR